MTQMRAVQVKGDGKTADDLYIDQVERPKPQKGQVLVKVNAFGLNRMDIMQRQGFYPLPPGVTDILGVEFSGVVEESAGAKFNKGDAVFGLAYGGAYAEYICVHEGMVSAKPEGVTDVQAAAICENWLTAYQALYWIGETEPGQSVLIHAGGSGVGLAAVQLAKTFGASKIFATAGTDDKVKFVGQHGATCFNYKTQDWAEEVSKATDKAGVNVIIDLVGASYWEKNIASLQRDGHLVLVGLVGGRQTEKPLDLGMLLFKRLRVQGQSFVCMPNPIRPTLNSFQSARGTGTTLRSRSLEYQSELLGEFSEKALHKLFSRCNGQNGLDLVIHKVYNWEHISEAHKEMEDAKNTGKIICTL
ncbi:BQ2448_6480 [Microbotryum intermedium]|uniref:BQ2448_6480 protein n=1 Tax=Microbotryum intermedium TaxID=269621 RepID=A0A238FS45_9BASI|nr:BQ2448_6480 [Microbotryum intermedium]